MKQIRVIQHILFVNIKQESNYFNYKVIFGSFKILANTSPSFSFSLCRKDRY